MQNNNAVKLLWVGDYTVLKHGGNHAFEIALTNGQTELAFRQGGLGIWAFPSRPKMAKANIQQLESQLNFLLTEQGKE
jgi:hypothetical protein